MIFVNGEYEEIKTKEDAVAVARKHLGDDYANKLAELFSPIGQMLTEINELLSEINELEAQIMEYEDEIEELKNNTCPL